MRISRRALLAVTACLLLGPVATAASPPPGYAYYEIGDIAAPTPGPRSAGLMLMGGGDWDYGAFRWFAAHAGHGHIVVLRASGEGEAGDEIYRQVGGVGSVQTLVFSSRDASGNPKVLDILRHADGIFIAGGDQANYVRYWKDTPVARLLDDHVRAGKPIGGTSAGLAILGGTAYGAMDGGSIDSPTALGDPTGPAVTLVTGFLHLPRMAHVVTDTHFTVRNRLGRLIAFLAKARAGDPQAIGIGVDEKSSLCVDADGSARLHGPVGTYAWLVEPHGRLRTSRGQPLDWSGIRITGIGLNSGFDLTTRRVTAPAFSGVARVERGLLSDVPVPPAAATK